jgi:hypothetical protein
LRSSSSATGTPFSHNMFRCRIITRIAKYGPSRKDNTCLGLTCRAQ